MDFGDVISMDGNRYYVLEASSYRITVAPQDSTYSYDVDSFRDSEKDNRISEIKYEAKNHFNDMDNITLEEIESYDPDEYMGKIDIYTLFLKDRCEIGNNYRMKTSDVFDSYVEYCKEHDIAMVKRAKFYESLTNKKITHY